MVGRRTRAAAAPGSDDNEMPAPKNAKPKVLKGKKAVKVEAAAAAAAAAAAETAASEEEQEGGPSTQKPKASQAKGSGKKRKQRTQATPSQRGTPRRQTRGGSSSDDGGGDGALRQDAVTSQQRGSWQAASNVAPDLQPKVKHAFIQVGCSLKVL